MGRILFFVLLALAVYIGFRIWSAGRRRGDGAQARRPGGEAEAMVSCAHCGLNVPRTEAIGEGGRWFCSDRHRRLHLEDR